MLHRDARRPALLRPDVHHHKLFYPRHAPPGGFTTFFLQTGAVANRVHREGLLCSGGRRGHRAHLLEHIAPQLVTTTSMALRHIGNGGGVMERMQGVRDTEVLLQGS
jgi:hypothetical protein